MLRPVLATASAALLCGCAADANDAVEPALELTGRVVDAADIFGAPFESEMTERLAALESETGVQLVVVSTPSLQEQDVAVYTLELANAWGVGSAEKNDGLVLLVAPNEQRVRIEVGQGLVASVRDEEAEQILDEHVLPEFSRGNYETGVSEGVEELISEVTPVPTKEAA